MSEQLNQGEAVRYIVKMTDELKKMASHADEAFLSLLLEMVVVEGTMVLASRKADNSASESSDAAYRFAKGGQFGENHDGLNEIRPPECRKIRPARSSSSKAR